MSQALHSTQNAPPVLSTVIYRSRAVQPLTGPDLHRLTRLAQSRNRVESVTGVVVYDHETFFQWLEGPAENVARVMGSIRADPRHTDIEILDDKQAGTRQFGDWDLKLAARLPAAAAWQQDVIEPPADIIDALHRRPKVAAALLAGLVSAAAGDPGNTTATAAANLHLTGAGATRPGTMNSKPLDTGTILRDVIKATVLPELIGRLATVPVVALSLDPRANELAELLLAADPEAALVLMRQSLAAAHSLAPLYASLFEPAARGLGDLWNDDRCSEIDVTLALSRLQSAVRRLIPEALPEHDSAAPHRNVLVAPEPGELHMIGAAFDADALWQAGWTPHCEYPVNDRALQDLLAASWYDALDLSLSAAFAREHWLPRMTETIRRARRASRNPALLVVVGGRVFVEQDDAGARVGADAASTTSLEVERLILEGAAR